MNPQISMCPISCTCYQETTNAVALVTASAQEESSNKVVLFSGILSTCDVQEVLSFIIQMQWLTVLGLLGSGLKTWIPSTRDSLVLSQSLILTLYVCMGVAVLRVKLEYRAPWDPWTENKNVRGHVSKGKHGCKCPGYLPIASAWKKGCFLPFYVFCNKSSVWMPL